MSTEVPLPREPSAFSPSNLFAQRLRGRGADGYDRHLDGEVVRRCITRGECYRDGRDIFCFEADVDGVTFELVVRDSSREVITGRPTNVDADRARASERWSAEQISEIEAFLDDRGSR
jgi:hypothetical protein